jgi:hypothetical protein
VALPPAAVLLETRSIGAEGAPTLGRAYELLRDQWRSGDRDRELGLHLMFLAWYLLIEPPFLTGLDTAQVEDGELAGVFNDVHAVLLSTGTTDAEALYVVGLMAQLAPWLLGPVHEWTSRSEAYRSRYRQLLPNGIDPKVFAGRGAYGDYFGGQARVKDGY